MASVFANRENSDSDSSWADFTDEILNMSVKGTAKGKNLHKIDGCEMKKSSSSEEFEVIDNIESLCCSDKSSDDDSDSFLRVADEEVSIYSEGIITTALSSDESEVLVDIKTISDKGETVRPYVPTTLNLEQNFKEGNEKLGALYKPISKYLFGSKKEEAVFDRLCNEKSKKSFIYSDDESWKAPSSHFNEGVYYRKYINLLAKNGLHRNRTRKSEHYSLLFCTIMVAFCTVILYDLKRTGHTIPLDPILKQTTLTPVKTSHLGWDALTEEFKPVLNMLNDRLDLDNEEECPACNVNFEEKKEKLQGISFKMLRNDMMISIGVDERKTYVIYEKNGVIDVKMISKNLRNDTKLLFTLPQEISMTELMEVCPFLRFMKLAAKVVDATFIALLLFVKILIGIAIAFLRVLFWCVDIYMKSIWKIFSWQ